ncbi:hypothetical protein Phum_PHUM560900 [Pediculus humanus corporis]|uniref:Uncharacterized protein n=1 Tax=Pediculus humanus subsp. corporis TaxID=121224 RepID=E0W0M8_PEDHC|nr:uncharacterized protein Phum_PHUM560900 [Pediculus humanus corporis]EEB19184.1 hypothetical protein Phum_PHUM560900 [Pediculus humanus corporis]
MRPKSPYSQSQGKISRDFIYRGINKPRNTSYPVPVHAVPPRTRHRPYKPFKWQSSHLPVIDDDLNDSNKPPIPPPRKKRKRKINSSEVLNNQLPELCSPSYVLYSENLMNQNKTNKSNGNGNNGNRMFERSHCKKKNSGQDRFGKISGNRMKKFLMDSTSKDVKDEEMKNNNNNNKNKKMERKIKHVSTVSLPNYNELIKKSLRKVSADAENVDYKNGNQSATGSVKLPRRNSSSISLPGEGSNSILSSLSEATINCFENYMKRCRSFGSLKPQMLTDKSNDFNKTHRSSSESSDSWSGLGEWDLGVIEHCQPTHNAESHVKPKLKKNKEDFVFSRDVNNKYRGKKFNDKLNDEIITEIKTVEIKSVPLEWFLNPEKRPPAIMPATKSGKIFSITPPPSPEGGETTDEENDGNFPLEFDTNPTEHSSLLKILKQYKEDKSDEKTQMDAEKLVNVVITNDSQKNSMNFDEVNPNDDDDNDDESSKEYQTNLFIRRISRSNSFGNEKSNPPLQDWYRLRSPSVGLECSTQLLRQLQKNQEDIEREIFLRPNELLNRLRRESLFRSVPKDAFEAFEKRKTIHLRESLNEFLGFKNDDKDTATTDDNNDENLKKKKN